MFLIRGYVVHQTTDEASVLAYFLLLQMCYFYIKQPVRWNIWVGQNVYDIILQCSILCYNIVPFRVQAL